jgi:hypothetical protein
MLAEFGGQAYRMDMAVLRRGDVGTYVIALYPRETLGLMPIIAAVQKLDARIERFLSSDN